MLSHLTLECTIDELQGEVQVQSVEGKGTIFTCIIPCRIPLADITNYENIFNSLPAETKPEEKKSYATVFTNDESEEESKPEIENIIETKPAKKDAALKTSPQKGVKALLVEDDQTAQILADGVLSNISYLNYDTAETGKEALDMWSKNKYDFILMDLGLPDIKGDQVTKQIREKIKTL